MLYSKKYIGMTSDEYGGYDIYPVSFMFGERANTIYMAHIQSGYLSDGILVLQVNGRNDINKEISWVKSSVGKNISYQEKISDREIEIVFVLLATSDSDFRRKSEYLQLCLFEPKELYISFTDDFNFMYRVIFSDLKFGPENNNVLKGVLTAKLIEPYKFTNIQHDVYFGADETSYALEPSVSYNELTRIGLEEIKIEAEAVNKISLTGSDDRIIGNVIFTEDLSGDILINADGLKVNGQTRNELIDLESDFEKFFDKVYMPTISFGESDKFSTVHFYYRE